MSNPQQTKFFQETVRPSDALKGKNADKDEGLTSYKVTADANATAVEDDEDAAFLAKYKPRIGAFPNQPKPHTEHTHAPTVHKPVVRASDALRSQPAHQPSQGGVWGSKYGNSNTHHESSQPRGAPGGGVVTESTVRPSSGRQDGSDDLDKYRMTSSSTSEAGNQPFRPSVLSHNNEDPMDKYRVKPSAPQPSSQASSSVSVSAEVSNPGRWEFRFRNIPASPSEQIELKVNGQSVLTHPGDEGFVNIDSFISPGVDARFDVLIPMIPNFSFSRDMKASAGTFVRFMIEDNQFKFRQQKTEFTD
eukprot:TRINITY_DN2284_c3_g1_i3.p1 TRINITY_DN2284_c3_g1~~TRINITY_DN2284_c3_g1_i3.p1  ORF type:complete len:304 (-),score=80.06 TRINITY_DN2284_c3_g1_i3:31-942(-)